MKTDTKNNEKYEDRSTELFSKLQISWESPKEEIWGDFSKRLKERPTIKIRPNIISWQMAAAAVLILTIGISFFMRSYTKDINAMDGMHLTASLPDGSTVYLNAGSKISYKPYWWFMDRIVDLDGEAFFEVKKGETFRVESPIGTTEVLGTSFNVMSRGRRYEVTCVTGKVKVEANSTKQSVIIHPAQKASFQKSGQFKIEENVNTENTRAWMSNRLVFTSVSLKEVFEEIERQYKVEIISPKGLALQYTGSFEKGNSAEEILGLICRPFNLKVEKKSDKKFLILR
ncbi:MAG: iron dicitrate transport regulator FecR [Bacteroidetes bacterium]|nr:MAG: iron dicitrate transport regulator FecR [Bacteroidota bacterium]